MEKANEVSIESYFAETSLKTKKVVCTWTVKSALYCYKEFGISICSPKFTARISDTEFKWYIALFLGGIAENNEWTGVKVSSKGFQSTGYVKLSIINKYERESIQFEGFHEFTKTFFDGSLLVTEFIKKSTLSSMTSNGNLTIKCAIYFNQEVENSSISSSSIQLADESTVLRRLVTEFEDFGKLLTNPKFSDVKLVIGETEIPAHKNVLAARSPVFSAMFEHDMKENRENIVSIDDIDVEVMKEVLLFIYTGKVSDVKSMAKELLRVADKYALNGLKIICEEALIATMSDETIVEILTLVDQYNADKLCAAAVDYVTIHASNLATMDSFLSGINNLTPPLLAQVIKAFMLKA